MSTPRGGVCCSAGFRKAQGMGIRQGYAPLQTLWPLGVCSHCYSGEFHAALMLLIQVQPGSTWLSVCSVTLYITPQGNSLGTHTCTAMKCKQVDIQGPTPDNGDGSQLIGACISLLGIVLGRFLLCPSGGPSGMSSSSEALLVADSIICPHVGLPLALCYSPVFHSCSLK